MISKNIKNFKFIFFITLVITFICLIYYFSNNYFRLEAVDHSEQKILCTKIVKKGEKFILRFQNSISKTIAEEEFTILGLNNIQLSEFRYQSCDAGFPLGYEGEFSLKNGFMVIKYNNKEFTQIDNIRIATTYPHYLIFDDNSVCNLTKEAAGHVLLLKVNKIFHL